MQIPSGQEDFSVTEAIAANSDENSDWKNTGTTTNGVRKRTRVQYPAWEK